MDVPDIELVVVIGMPSTITEFYQVRVLPVYEKAFMCVYLYV